MILELHNYIEVFLTNLASSCAEISSLYNAFESKAKIQLKETQEMSEVRDKKLQDLVQRWTNTS